jgi:hypothetical protein
MSEIECGYLYSSQVSSIVSFIFGFFATALYFQNASNFNSISTFFALSGSLAQSIFGLMAIVIFYYFVQNYYTDDGVNREYSSPDYSLLSYDAAFYLWMCSIVISFLISVLGYYILHKKKLSF